MEPETPEVNWESVLKLLHGKVKQLLDQFGGARSGRPGESEDTMHHMQLQPDATPVYSAPCPTGPHRQ